MRLLLYSHTSIPTLLLVCRQWSWARTAATLWFVLAVSPGCCESLFQLQFPIIANSAGISGASHSNKWWHRNHCILFWGLAKAFLNTAKQQGFAWSVPHPSSPFTSLPDSMKTCKTPQIPLEGAARIQGSHQHIHMDYGSLKHSWRSSPEHTGGCHCQPGY